MALAAVMAALALVPPALAGGLDPSFGRRGLTLTYISEEPDLPYGGPVIFPDGSFAAVTDSRNSLWRWSRDGHELNPIAAPLTVNPLAMVRADDRLLIAGGESSPSEQPAIGVQAVSPAGVPDERFGSGGTSFLRVAGGNHYVATALATVGEGRIVVAGTAVVDGDVRLVVGRLLPDGTADPGFGNQGVVTTTVTGATERYDPDRFFWTEAGGLALDGQGRVVLVATVRDERTHLGKVAVIRHLPDGSHDASFGDGRGYATVEYRSGAHSFGAALALQGSKIVVGGSTFRGEHYRPALARLDEPVAWTRPSAMAAAR